MVEKIHFPEIYTCEKEPRGAKTWIPLTDNGRFLKHNIVKIARLRPSVLWVYDQYALKNLEMYDLPFTELRYPRGMIPPGSRWAEKRTFFPGKDDFID